jgi:hypothetical protein
MKKRIFLTLPANASSGYNDLTYKYIFYDTLVMMGYDVVFFPYHEATINGQSHKISDLRLISENIYAKFIFCHKEKPFDLFLSYYHGGQVLPELFRQVRESVLCVNYTTNFHQVDLYAPLLKEADLSIFVSIAAKPYFEQHGYKGYYMPFAGLRSNLSLNPIKNGRISFIGTSYGPRATYVWRCLQNNIPISIFGTNWIQNHTRRAALRTLQLESRIISGGKNTVDTAYRILNDLILKEINAKYAQSIHDPLPDEAYHQLLSESSIVLNFPESRYGHDYTNPGVLIGANLRDFEVPTTGSFLLTQDNDEIRSFFEPGREIETFSNEWEMIDKARFYLAHPDLLLRIAEAGNDRTAKEHLWEHRFHALFAHLEQNYL